MTQTAVAMVLILAAAAGLLADARGAGRGFLSLQTDMQPQVVATTLVRVEDQWRSQVTDFVECNMTSSPGACSDNPWQFRKSCSKIVDAVLQSSNGDRGVVQEYMTAVCGEDQLKGWRSDFCRVFANTVSAAMTEDAYANREELDATGVCRQLWHGLADEESVRVQKERAEREAAEREAAEQQRLAAADKAAKAAEAAAAAERQRAAQRAAQEAAEAKRKAEEAVKRTQEQAAHQADEAKRKIAEAQADIDSTRRSVTSPDTTVAAAAVAAVPPHIGSVPANATKGEPRNATEAVHQNTSELVRVSVPTSTQNITNITQIANTTNISEGAGGHQ